MEEINEIHELYPEMILISDSPPTWVGVLAVNTNFINCQMKIKVKLTMPSFPRLDNATINFGGNIAFLFSKKFKNQIESIISRAESVSECFQEIINLIEKLLNQTDKNESQFRLIDTNTFKKLLEELRNILSDDSGVEFSSTKNLSAVKLTLNEISMIVQPTGHSSWKIISSDLPELSGYSINDKKLYSLKEIKNLFKKQVDLLEEVWNQLTKIDKYCWVTDPINPKPYHLYRRIYLSPTMSFLLTLNPLDPTGYPRIKFLGAKSEVEKYIDKMQDSIDNWDPDYSVHENLLTLLDIDEFPENTKTNNKMEEIDGMVGDEECCICFSKEAEEGGELPEEICNNHRCRRQFHSKCLYQWLQELATNKIVFNQIFGSCPNCGEEISCHVSKS